MIAQPSEQVNSFLEAYGIVPTYLDPNYVFGYFDEVNGIWTGMIGHVSLFAIFRLDLGVRGWWLVGCLLGFKERERLQL